MVLIIHLRPAEQIDAFRCSLFSCVAFLAAWLLLTPPAFCSETTLTWHRSSDPKVAGYRLYYGNASRDYSFALDLGKQTSWSSRNLDLIEGIPYYFAVKAYDRAGNESDFSAEVSQTIYEDAEDISTAGWDLCSPVGAVGGIITNVFDSERESKVISLSGDSVSECYRLRRADFTNWNNETQFVIAWSMKCDSWFRATVVVETSTATLQLNYRPMDYDSPAVQNCIDFGVGSGANDGRWHTFRRNLQTDISRALPGVTIVKVKYFVFFGRGRVTNIKLMQSP